MSNDLAYREKVAELLRLVEADHVPPRVRRPLAAPIYC